MAAAPLLPSALVQDDDGTQSEAARAKLAKRSFRARFTRTRRKESDPQASLSVQEQPDDESQNLTPAGPINLESAISDTGDLSKDQYRWAVLYENQRGMVLFSIPYFSSSSLLPNDPPSWTMPEHRKSRGEHPLVTPETYPLPSGQWKWVSREWLIDMRHGGQVDHDGFEYNWVFRSKHWRAEVGKFSSGGYVRRRRWIRLMGRFSLPAESRMTTPLSSRPVSIVTGHESRPLSTRNSRASSIYSGALQSLDADDVWIGDDPEMQWTRYRFFTRLLPTDGKKLQVWTKWLQLDPDVIHPTKGSRRQWTEDGEPGIPLPHNNNSSPDSQMPSRPAQRDSIVSALRNHGEEILGYFVFPQSRVEFCQLLDSSGLLSDLEVNSQSPTKLLDFWSYSSNLNIKIGPSTALQVSPNEGSPAQNQ